MQKLEKSFFLRDVLEVAPELVGKIIRIQTSRGIENYRITETEAYRGEEDLACGSVKHSGWFVNISLFILRPWK